jgi:GAF domain-containing protein
MKSPNSYLRLLTRERTAKKICADLNHFTDLKPTLITVISHIRKLTGGEAVAIRLHDGEDYPYYVYDGFPDSFIEKENSLCARDAQGVRISSPDGRGYLLDCMCGNIIQGRFDPAHPFFSRRGSFWSNHTTALLASTSEEQRQANTRNYCNGCGYESVALIPLRVQDDRIGLIQINDHRTGLFTRSLIEFLEMIGEHVGLAVRNAMTHTKLKAALEEIQRLRGILPICCHCKKIRDDRGYWTQVEVYIRNHSEAEFSHGICPDCEQKLYPNLTECGRSSAHGQNPDRR